MKKEFLFANKFYNVGGEDERNGGNTSEETATEEATEETTEEEAAEEA